MLIFKVADLEVFAHDWVFVCKDFKTDNYTVIHNDNAAVREVVTDEDAVFVFFNGKHYDSYIVKAICAGFTPEEIKKVNDYIIAGGQGWECPLLQGIWFRFNNIDIKDDMQMGLSLKAIEGHLGMDICESEIDFTLERQLTPEELESTIFYCKHDVDATERILDLRKNYLQTKLDIGKMCGLSEVKALSMTNAKLTAAFLGAVKQPHDDEREYVIPSNLDMRYVPQEVLEFYKRIYDPNIPDKELFSSKLNLKMGDCNVVVSYGGIHGCIPNYLWEEDGNET